MKKIFMAASLVAGLTLITSCSVKLHEDNKNSDHKNTICRGRNTHNFTVINNKLEDINNNKLEDIKKQNEDIKKQNEKILEILNKQN